MTELQRRVLVEAEFLFYLATSPTLFALDGLEKADVGVQSSWLSAVSTSELIRVNERARILLREGSLASRPQSPIKVTADTNVPVKVRDGASK